MLRIMQRWFGRSKPPATSQPAADTAVLLVRVPPQPAPAPPAPAPPDQVSSSAVSTPAAIHPPAPRTAKRPSEQASLAVVPRSDEPRAVAADSAALQPAIATHPPAAERAALPLAALGVISERLLRQLQRAGLRSCEDLLGVDPAALVQQLGAPNHQAARIRRYQRGIRFSRRFSAMTPHEALLLFATHRRSPIGLATENAGILRRDLQRLLLSSRGQKLAAGCPAPELQRVRQWIAEAKVLQERKNRALRAANQDSELPRIAPTRKSVD